MPNIQALDLHPLVCFRFSNSLQSLKLSSCSEFTPLSSLWTSLDLNRSIFMSSSGSSAMGSPSPPPSPPLSPPPSPSGSVDMDGIWPREGIDPFLETPLVLCGGKDADQDTTIFMILPGLPEEETDYLPPLSEVRVHSRRLRTCSKYFAALLNPPCSKRKRTPLEFKLEALTNVTVYTDCFKRMYTPFQKSFEDVSYALHLLRVATQIEFTELMRSICRYLSSVQWSGEEELKIRRYVASPNFPRSHAPELLARVERNEDRCSPVRLLIQNCMRSLHNIDNNSSRVLLEELLKAVRQSECLTFEQDLGTIINEEAKRMIEDVHMNYDSYVNSSQQVPKLKVVYSVLKALLGAFLGEAGVSCFLRLENYPSILANAARSLNPELHCVATEFSGLILSICTQVANGNLLLEIPDRVTLSKNWRPLFENLGIIESFTRMVASLFHTLPFEQQMELLNDEAKNDNYNTYISPQALAKLLKDQWTVDDDAGMQAEMD